MKICNIECEMVMAWRGVEGVYPPNSSDSITAIRIPSRIRITSYFYVFEFSFFDRSNFDRCFEINNRLHHWIHRENSHCFTQFSHIHRHFFFVIFYGNFDSSERSWNVLWNVAMDLNLKYIKNGSSRLKWRISCSFGRCRGISWNSMKISCS